MLYVHLKTPLDLKDGGVLWSDLHFLMASSSPGKFPSVLAWTAGHCIYDAALRGQLAECRQLRPSWLNAEARSGILGFAMVCPNQEGGRAMRSHSGLACPENVFQVPFVAWEVQRSGPLFLLT